MIDYIYRFDPENPSTKPPPADAASARKALEDGNRTFARFVASCQGGTAAPGQESRHVVTSNIQEVGLLRKSGGAPKQAPFGAVVGCSDARVPVEMLFGQGFNSLFVVRVAGNVLGDDCLGSIDFAVTALAESVKVLVVLGHSGCGAVTAAVNAYLRPDTFWAQAMSPPLRGLAQKILVPVCEAAGGLEAVWGPQAETQPGYRDALIEAAVCLNAAQAAFALRQGLESSGRRAIEVLYGVYNLHNFQVRMPNNPLAPPSEEEVRLAPAPGDPKEFAALAVKMAEILKPLAGTPSAQAPR